MTAAVPSCGPPRRSKPEFLSLDPDAPSLMGVADGLPSGAQQGVDLLAPSKETSGLHAVTTGVGVSDWRAGLAVRSHVPALVRHHRHTPPRLGQRLSHYCANCLSARIDVLDDHRLTALVAHPLESLD